MLSFLFSDPATTEIYTLSLHDALPILPWNQWSERGVCSAASTVTKPRSEEHTSELQSRLHLVCRLLLEKKNAVFTLDQDVGVAYRHAFDQLEEILHLLSLTDDVG